MSTVLHVEIPASWIPERTYAVTTVLQDFLGLQVHVVVADAVSATTISTGDGRRLVLADGFFAMAESLRLQPQSVGRFVDVGGLPSLPAHAPNIDQGHDGQLGLDVLGTSFFLLSRYEEVASPRLDSHGRFPMAASVSREHLGRPLVDEHVEVLWTALARMWPGLERRRRSFSVSATHDVDHAFAYTACSPAGLARLSARKLVHERDVRGALRAPMEWAAVRAGGVRRDPFNTYDLIMDTCESAGAACSFYVIPDPAPGGRDPRHVYTVEDRRVGDVLRRVAGRGHEIGIHPSYASHLAPDQLAGELQRLRSALSVHGLSAEVRGGRQHYLRWSAERTWAIWDALGLEYDSSVGYAEAPGFRAGVCHDYPTFDLRSRRPLALRERPLIVMERTLEDYLRLDLEGAPARSTLSDLKAWTKKFGGEFVVLWHNSSLADPRHVELYREAIGR